MPLRIAFAFPGQGSQRPGMLSDIPAADSLGALLEQAEKSSGLPLAQMAASGSEEQLADTRVAQPLLFLADWAWADLAMRSGIRPDVVAGHSLGELAALAVAGVVSVESGLELVIKRSRLMAEAAAAHPGAMSAVLGLPAASIAAALEGLDSVWVANDNSAGQVVISGSAESVEAAMPRLLEAGARRVVPLKVSGAFHSPMMRDAADAFAGVLGEVEMQDARIPVIQNTEPTTATDADTIRQRLIGQMTSPVRWTETMNAVVSEGPALLVECGPGSVLSGLAKKVDGLSAVSIESSGVERVLEEVSTDA